MVAFQHSSSCKRPSGDFFWLYLPHSFSRDTNSGGACPRNLSEKSLLGALCKLQVAKMLGCMSPLTAVLWSFVLMIELFGISISTQVAVAKKKSKSDLLRPLWTSSECFLCGSFTNPLKPLPPRVARSFPAEFVAGLPSLAGWPGRRRPKRPSRNPRGGYSRNPMYGSKSNHRGTAGFSSWFHLPIFDPQPCVEARNILAAARRLMPTVGWVIDFQRSLRFETHLKRAYVFFQNFVKKLVDIYGTVLVSLLFVDGRPYPHISQPVLAPW